MLETGDWITPWFRPDVPFWGKPPLFAWLTAGSLGLFGISEFAARLPHFLLGLGTLWLVLQVAATRPDRKQGWLAMLVLASSALFFATATISDTIHTKSAFRTHIPIYLRQIQTLPEVTYVSLTVTVDVLFPFARGKEPRWEQVRFIKIRQKRNQDRPCGCCCCCAG